MKVTSVHVAAILLLLATLSITYAVLRDRITIPSHGDVEYQLSDEWEYESVQLNFLATDVIPGGTTVIAGSGNSGAIFRSTDEGATWTHVATLPGITQIWMVYCDSRSYFFASGDYGGGDGGLWRSTDDGLNWTRVWWHSSGTFVHSSGICEDEAGDLYIGSYNPNWMSQPVVCKSMDGGATWVQIATFDEGHIHCLRYNPNTGKMWCWVGDPGHSGYGFYWSPDYGVTWHRTSITEGNLNGYNIMSFECYENYIFFARHWSQAELYRVDFTEMDGVPPSNPTAVELWRGGFDRLNWVRRYKNWLLASGEAHSGQAQMKIGGSGTAPFNSGTWEHVYLDGTSTSDGGCAVASHHWSLNGWFFVSNTIMGQGIRIRAY